MYQKRFSLAKYGTWRAAQKAGKEWVENLKKELPPSESNAPGRMTSKNQSGVVGVSLARNVTRKKSGLEYEYWSWLANWRTPKGRKMVTYQISESRSDEDAFVMAVLSREMATTDKAEVQAVFNKIRGKKKHKDILAKKAMVLEFEYE